MELIKLSYKYLLLVVLFIGCTKNTTKQFTESDITIIPKPLVVKLKKGTFTFNKNTVAIITNKEQQTAANVLVQKFKNAAGYHLKITNETPKNNFVLFQKNDTLSKEAYTVEVTPKSVIISSRDVGGWLYGVHSLLQLLPETIESTTLVKNEQWTIPEVTIIDKPRYQWRGLMLDVSRHFFDKQYIKKTIDRLAMHKMNVLHLHLIDDQGWRIEIKKYPKLTGVGAWRVNQEHLHWNSRRTVSSEEKGNYGGFFTQNDLKEIVAYAQKRGIEVVPEIEMPAHISSAIAAYPWLSCTEKPIGVPSGGVWPITDIYCAGKESTFQFLEDVLKETMAIFPSKYIHIGGDEATKTHWKTCKDCQQRMKKERLKNVEELQSYFIKRIEKFLNANNKKLIGWDEILEGGLAPDATVMSWRGVKGGIEAAKQGHDVVMTPGTHCYFDHYQGSPDKEPLAIGGHTTLSKVYQFDPTVSSLTAKEAEHILGGQANLWSEYIPTTSHSEYMLYPRLTALSETLWSAKKHRNWNNFASRIKKMFKRYSTLGINYAKSSYAVTADVQANSSGKSVALKLQNEYPNADIRYTLNGENPTENTTKYTQPIVLKNTTTVKALLFENNKPLGNVFVDTIKFHKAVAKNVTYNIPHHNKYKGTGVKNLVNTIRGSKSFSDGNWQGWLNKNMSVTINLEEETEITKVTLGALENQGPDIFFPTEVKVSISINGKDFKQVGTVKRPYKANDKRSLKNFVVNFKKQSAKYVKIEAVCMKKHPKGRGIWLFIDEVLIE